MEVGGQSGRGASGGAGGDNDQRVHVVVWSISGPVRAHRFLLYGLCRYHVGTCTLGNGGAVVTVGRLLLPQ